MESKKNSNIILAIIWPFFGLIQSLKNWRQPWAMNIFWVVCIYMGAIQIFHPEGTILGDGSDGGRYVLRLIEMHNGSLGLIEQIAYSFKLNGSMDYYQLILTWIVSLFTDNGHILFACFAAVFGFFYSRNMWYVLNHISGYLNTAMVIFISLLFLACPIWQINGVRMWTAAHIFMYAVLPYIWEGNKKRLWWLLAVPFVHFSYLYFVILSFAFVLIPNKITADSKIMSWGLMFALVLSLIVGMLKVPAIIQILERFSPDAYQDRIDLYTSDAAFERMGGVRKSVNWYVTASSDIAYWISNIVLICLSIFPLKDQKSRKMLNFCLLISIIANVASQLPSGGRFITIAHLFTYSLVIWQIGNINKLFNQLVSVMALPLLITIIFSVRTAMDYYGISFIVGNYFTSLFWNDNIPLINFIKIL